MNIADADPIVHLNISRSGIFDKHEKINTGENERTKNDS